MMKSFWHSRRPRAGRRAELAEPAGLKKISEFICAICRIGYSFRAFEQFRSDKGKRRVFKMYGFSKSNYETFQTSYSQYVQNVAKNDYMEVSLFKQVRQEIGKDNFQKFLTDAIGLTDKEISTLRNKLMAFDRLSDRAIWEALGYSNINKILSLPKSVRNHLIDELRNSALTLSSFSTLYNRVVSGDKVVGDMQRDSNNRRESKPISSAQIQRIVMETINRTLGSEIQPVKRNSRRQDSQGQRNRGRNRGQRRNQNWNRQTCSNQPVFPFVTA